MTIPPCLAVLGPTCCWKSETALRLAEAVGGEIVSCDSMQVYRHLDIGTAKPTPDERARVPHHLVDMLELDAPYDASRFVTLASAALDDIASRGKTAVLVGGTGLYARALIYGFSLLPADPAVFQRLDRRCQEAGGREELLKRLQQAADKLHTDVPVECRLNPRRLIRACEVLELTGQPPWLLKSKNEQPDPRFRQFCIVPELNLVKERIRRRTAIMLQQGWLAEAVAAENLGLSRTPTARQALGYPELIAYSQNPLPGGLEALTELLANKTIQYARRQLTWFKHQHPGAVMLAPTQTDNAADWLYDQIRANLGL